MVGVAQFGLESCIWDADVAGSNPVTRTEGKLINEYGRQARLQLRRDCGVS